MAARELLIQYMPIHFGVRNIFLIDSDARNTLTPVILGVRRVSVVCVLISFSTFIRGSHSYSQLGRLLRHKT